MVSALRGNPSKQFSPSESSEIGGRRRASPLRIFFSALALGTAKQWDYASRIATWEKWGRSVPAKLRAEQ